MIKAIFHYDAGPRLQAKFAALRADGLDIAPCPEAVPALLGEDEANGMFAMEYLDPGAYPVWKHLLRDGQADPASAASVGERLARIHAATAGDPAIARNFATDDGFYAIRIEP
jgi:5-methylthioribose kinase